MEVHCQSMNDMIGVIISGISGDDIGRGKPHAEDQPAATAAATPWAEVSACQSPLNNYSLPFSPRLRRPFLWLLRRVEHPAPYVLRTRPRVLNKSMTKGQTLQEADYPASKHHHRIMHVTGNIAYNSGSAVPMPWNSVPFKLSYQSYNIVPFQPISELFLSTTRIFHPPSPVPSF